MITVIFNKTVEPYAYFAQISTHNGKYYLFSDSKCSAPLEKSKENMEAFTQAFLKQDFQSFQKVYMLLNQKKSEGKEYDKNFLEEMEKKLESRKCELKKHIEQIVRPYQDELDEIDYLLNKKSS